MYRKTNTVTNKPTTSLCLLSQRWQMWKVAMHWHSDPQQGGIKWVW